jgi:hypothetical protein
MRAASNGLYGKSVLLRVPHNRIFWRGVEAWMPCSIMREVWFAGVNRAREFTPRARVMLLESKRAKTHMTVVWIINNARLNKHARVIGFGEGRGPT